MVKTTILPQTRIGGQVPTNDARNGIQLCIPFRVQVTIEGTSAVLFHRWSCEAIESKAKAKKGSAEKKTDDTESYVESS